MDLYPVSLQQENRLLREGHLAGGLPERFAYLVPIAVPFHEPVDAEALRSALTAVAARHDALRTRFARANGGEYLQYFSAAPGSVAMEIVDAADEPRIREILADEFGTPFTATDSLFLRARLLCHSPSASTLLLVTEHVVADEVSAVNLSGDLLRHYDRRQGAREADWPPGPIQYGDWSVWQRQALGGAWGRQLMGFWRDVLMPQGPFPALELFHPLDGKERARVRTLTTRLAGELHASLLAIGFPARTSTFLRILTVIQIATALVSHEQFAVVHSATANRRFPQVQDMVAWFAHGLPFRIDLTDEMTLHEVAATAWRANVRALDHQDMPLTSIVRELVPDAHGAARGLRPPRVYLGFYERRLEPESALVDLERIDVRPGDTSWAQPGVSIDAFAGPGDVELRIHYGEGRLAPARIEGLAKTIESTVRAMAGAPDMTVAEARRHLL
jgi:hypothetical protein